MHIEISLCDAENYIDCIKSVFNLRAGNYMSPETAEKTIARIHEDMEDKILQELKRVHEEMKNDK